MLGVRRRRSQPPVTPRQWPAQEKGLVKTYCKINEVSETPAPPVEVSRGQYNTVECLSLLVCFSHRMEFVVRVLLGYDAPIGDTQPLILAPGVIRRDGTKEIKC